VSAGTVVVVRGLVIAAGVAVTVAGALAMRTEDWPVYAVYLALALLLFAPAVEVLPRLAMPMPSLAVEIAFLYIGGLPIAFLRIAVPPTLAQLLRSVLPPSWQRRLPDRLWATSPRAAIRRFGTAERTAVGAEWAMFSIGLGVRWWVASALVTDGMPARHPEAVLLGELAGYGCWTILSYLPIFSFSSELFARPDGLKSACMNASSVTGFGAHFARRGELLRAVHADLGLIIVLALTPFVFLIVYGYAAHGLAGAAGWSLASLGLHVMLQRLNERRVTVERQNEALQALNRELEHRERLSAIGKMSSVVSHQMLQQLGIIRLHADLIRHVEADGDPARALQQVTEHAARIDDALVGVNRVLTDLLVFSRDLRLNLYEHPLDRVLAESVADCALQARERGVTLRLACDPDMSIVLDKLKTTQAVANLVRNALDVAPAGSEVLVEGRSRDDAVEIAVTDRGPGVAPADRRTIFTPFFTTKESGTGLGLAIAHEFVRAHGGRIDVETPPEGGARFVIRLPGRPDAGVRPASG
jgi:signal transduction histidine kinase